MAGLMGVAVCAFLIESRLTRTRAVETTPMTQSTRTYEQGLAEGTKAGQAEGYATGLQEGRAKWLKIGHERGYLDGHKVGKAAGYQDGYTAGNHAGLRSGLVQGCQAVFDQLKTGRVIDRVPAPGERYWYLNRDKCRFAGKW